MWWLDCEDDGGSDSWDYIYEGHHRRLKHKPIMTITETPLSDKAIERCPVFFAAVRKRLINGKDTYGDSSFEGPLLKVVDELQQECMDLAGWGEVLWSRLEDLKAQIAQLENTR